MNPLITGFIRGLCPVRRRAYTLQRQVGTPPGLTWANTVLDLTVRGQPDHREFGRSVRTVLELAIGGLAVTAASPEVMKATIRSPRTKWS
jgi:hypothetical protein